ncbi:MAG: peptidylprolyl isomerase [Nitrospirae bacterium]|nr:peptidylprolyl isomerase [Nitrospirota bacterium]
MRQNWKIRLQKLWSFFFSCCLISLVLLNCSPAFSDEIKVLPPQASAAATGTVPLNPAVIARVGAAVITDMDLQEAVSKKVQNMYSHGQDLTQKPAYRREALDELIEAQLIYYAALKEGLQISEAAVTGVVAQNVQSMGSEQALQEVLKLRGLSMEAFKEKIKTYLSANEFLIKLLKKSAYLEEELVTYYEKHRESFRRPASVRMQSILLKVDPSAMEDAWQKKREKAEELLKKIQSGEDFFMIAYNNSDDPYRVKGGDLGFIHKGMLTPEELETAAFALEPGQLSGVIRTIHGLHILKAGEKRPGELPEFEKVKDDLAQKLQKQRFDEKKAEILKRMKDEHPVTIMITIDDKP